jgi:glutaredoxin-like YruB-family protein
MTLKIYSLPACPHCKLAKAFFDANNVKYEDIDVSKNPEAVEEMKEKSGQMGTPVIDIDGQIVVGFDEPKLRELLKID